MTNCCVEACPLSEQDQVVQLLQNPSFTYLDQVSKYLSTDKTVRDSEVCQGQAAVEPEYCHAQVACPRMMMRIEIV